MQCIVLELLADLRAGDIPIERQSHLDTPQPDAHIRPQFYVRSLFRLLVHFKMLALVCNRGIII